MKSQLKLIQILRGIAASVVVIHHTLAELFESWSLQKHKYWIWKKWSRPIFCYQ